MRGDAAKRMVKVAALALVVLLAVTLALHLLRSLYWATGRVSEVSSYRVSGEEHANMAFRLVFAGSLGVIGALIARRRPSNRVGWLLLSISILIGLGRCMEQYAKYAAPGLWPPRFFGWSPRFSGVSVAAWLSEWLIRLAFGLLFTFLFLWFPHGRLPSPRWRPVAIAVAALLGAVVAASFGTPFATETFPNRPNPFYVDPLRFLNYKVAVMIDRPMKIVDLLLVLAFLPAALSLWIRLRNVSEDERRQIRWVASAGALVAVTYVLLYGLALWGTPIPRVVTEVGVKMVVLTIPVSAAVAIFKYRLYAIDVFISKAVFMTTMSLFIIVTYVAITVGAGVVTGLGEGSPYLALIAMGVVSIAFEPLKQRAHAMAGQIAYGDRFRPYEALARFSRLVSTAVDPTELLHLTADTATRLSDASSGSARLFLPDGTTRVARVADKEPEDTDPEEISVDVLFNDVAVGELRVRPRSGGSRSRDLEILLALAGQASVCFNNLRLLFELENRLAQLEHLEEELRGSQRRLVGAQFVVRQEVREELERRVERHLLELENLLEGIDPKVSTDSKPNLLREAAGKVDTALRELRRVARAILPPELRSAGVAAAIETDLADRPGSALVTDPTMTPPALGLAAESALYLAFAAVMRQTPAPVTVHLTTTAFSVEMTLTVDSSSFDPMRDLSPDAQRLLADRVEALLGRLEFTYSPGRIPTIRVSIPLSLEEGERG